VEQWLELEVKSSLCSMLDDGFSVYSFAYPNSNSNTAESDNKLLESFDIVRLYNGHDSTHQAGVYDNQDSVIMAAAIDEEMLNMSELEAVIDSIADNNQTLVLAAHDLIEDKNIGLFLKPSSLIQIINYANSKGVMFVNFKDIISPVANKVDYSVCL